jgi:hypothetical protein
MGRRVAALACLLFACLLHAQNESASLAGEVADSSGAAIVHAALRLVNVDTGESYETISTDTGHYAFPIVKAGRYQLTASLTGFKQFQQSGIVMETGVPSRADIRMEVGAMTEKVTVTAEAALVQSETSAVGAIVNNQTISQMPLVDRRATQLAKLSGFTVQTGTGSATAFTVAGGRGANGNFRMDGGNDTNIMLGTNAIILDPPVESLEEFNFSISNYSAELGRSGGGVIQMTTKSGTNTLHGSVYEFNRNTATSTRSFFSPKVPILHYNLFGASLGGPIRKNRTFFFFNYEGLRQSSQTQQILSVPTPAEVAGNFSADSYIVRDPTTAARAPFPGNIIPASAMDPVGKQVAAFYPAPNIAGRPSQNNNFTGPATRQFPSNNYVTRIDHSIRSTDRIYGRLGKTDSLETDLPFYANALVDSNSQTLSQSYWNATASWIHNFSGTALNEARFTYDRRKYLNNAGGTGSGLNGKLGIPGVDPTFFGQFTVTGLIGFGSISSVNPFGNQGESQQRLQSPITDHNFSDTFTLIRGSHQLKFGFEVRSSSSLEIDKLTGGGTFTFNNVATGNSLASLLLGWTASGSVAVAEPIIARAATYATFVQDDWKISQRLTLNLGVRWDIDTPRWAENNRQNSFDATAINPVCNCPGVITFSGQNGLSKYAHNFDKKDIGPRIGFAYRAGDKWVLRGGAGLLYIGQYDQATPTYAETGFAATSSLSSPDGGVTPAFLLKNGLPPLVFPTQDQLTPGFGAVPIGKAPTTSFDFFQPSGRKEGYLEQFNLNIQRELRRNLILEVGYLGTLGHHLSSPQQLNINQVPLSLMGPGNQQSHRPFPQFNNVLEDVPDIGNSNYHGMNVRLEKRFAHGLQFQANYTFSRLIDDLASRNQVNGVASDFQNIYNRQADRGLSGNDIKERFVWSSVWEVPVGRGKALDPHNAVLNHVIGGWSAGYIAVLQTGSPYEVVELTNTANAFSPGLRPNVVGNSNNLPGGRSKAQQLAQWFNTAAFAAPAPNTFGNAGRTDGYGPRLMSMDLSVLKDFHFTERQRLQFRLEMLNFLNHANFALPNQQRGSPAFGQITSLVAGNQSRIVQLGLHYKF